MSDDIAIEEEWQFLMNNIITQQYHHSSCTHHNSSGGDIFNITSLQWKPSNIITLQMVIRICLFKMNI